MKNININFLIIQIWYLLFSIGFSQSRVGEWEALTSVMKVNDVKIFGNTIYAATEGGLFEISNNEYSVHTTVDGLVGVDLSTISIDSSSSLIIGGSAPFGFLQIYNPLNKTSIKEFDFGLSAILDIQIIDNVCWVLFRKGQEYGIMKFIHDGEWQYRDSYNNFPTPSGNINCFYIYDSILYLGMTGGIYFADINQNLKDPTSWSPLIPNFSHNVSSMDLDEDYLRFTTSNNLYKFSLDGNQLTQIEFSFELQDASNLFFTENEMWFSDDKNLYLKNNINDFLIWDNYDISSFDYNGEQLVAGSKTGLIFCEEDINYNYKIQRLLPNSPVTSDFSSITILDDGRFVGGSGHGVSIYDGRGWRNILEIKENGTLKINTEVDYNFFIADTVAYDFGEYIADMEQGPDGLLYCAIRGSRVYSGNPPRWSGGVIVLDVDNPANIMTIDTTFLSYHTSSSNSIPYQVTLDVEFDINGNLWILNPYCINGNNPVHVRSAEGKWKHYGSSETSTRISQSPCSIAFDIWNRAWISSFQADEANMGIYPNGGISVLTYQDQPYAPSDFFWNVIDYSGTVWSLGYGNNNRLYYLTPSGLNYYDITENSNPILRQNSYPYFPNISFGSGAGISVDTHGNIWTYSPTQGVHVLLENTSYWPDINGFRASSYPLLSDEIRDIDFDSDRNLAYIATSKGVNILRIPFGNPKLDFDKVKVFPNPYHIPSVKPMRVDGIIYGSSMMITTLDGKLIRHIKTNGIDNDGDQLSWDGKDLNGHFVSTGVYLVLIYNNNGARHEDKIVVIKK